MKMILKVNIKMEIIMEMNLENEDDISRTLNFFIISNNKTKKQSLTKKLIPIQEPNSINGNQTVPNWHLQYLFFRFFFCKIICDVKYRKNIMHL